MAIGADRRWLGCQAKLRPAGSWAVVCTFIGLALHFRASSPGRSQVPYERFGNKVC